MDTKKRYTPDNLTTLEPHQVFVFGSNVKGLHSGGTAKLCYEKFGAVMGQPEGLQGQSYGIPTLDYVAYFERRRDTLRVFVEDVKKSVDTFTEFARQHPELEFLVCQIGCGSAGFKVQEIAPLFYTAWKELPNVILPEPFDSYISRYCQP